MNVTASVGQSPCLRAGLTSAEAFSHRVLGILSYGQRSSDLLYSMFMAANPARARHTNLSTKAACFPGPAPPSAGPFLLEPWEASEGHGVIRLSFACWHRLHFNHLHGPGLDHRTLTAMARRRGSTRSFSLTFAITVEE
jgi:hypothetical protein